MSTDEQAILHEKQSRFLFIDGLKGIACIMIMVGHFNGVVKYSSGITCFPFITWLNGSVFSIIIDEGFWLQLFFVISGFLLSYAKMDKIVDIIRGGGKKVPKILSSDIGGMHSNLYFSYDCWLS